MPVRIMATPGIVIARRQLHQAPAPRLTNAVNRSGITTCVTPPPRFPQPAEAAFAVPTMFGANISEV